MWGYCFTITFPLPNKVLWKYKSLRIILKGKKSETEKEPEGRKGEFVGQQVSVSSTL